MARARTLGAALAGLAALALPRAAWAGAAGATLRVDRAPGAEVCPSDSELAAQIESIAGEKPFTGPGEKKVEVRVAIAPAKQGFTATISLSGARRGERVLADRGPGCEVLGQALAVTLAVLLEEEDATTPEPPPEPPPPPPPQRPVWAPRYYLLPGIDPTPASAAAKDDRIPPLTISLSGFYDSGTLASDTGGLSLSADFFVPVVSVGVALVWLPDDTLELPNHNARYAFLGGSARACTRAPMADQFGAGVCLGLRGGGRSAHIALDADAVDAEGGFLEAQTQLELSRRIAGPFGLFTTLGLGVPFLVDAIDLELPTGQLVPSPLSFATFQLGVGVRFWVEPPVAAPKKTPR